MKLAKIVAQIRIWILEHLPIVVFDFVEEVNNECLKILYEVSK